jgi:hypothetical protein
LAVVASDRIGQGAVHAADLVDNDDKSREEYEQEEPRESMKPVGGRTEIWDMKHDPTNYTTTQNLSVGSLIGVALGDQGGQTRPRL